MVTPPKTPADTSPRMGSLTKRIFDQSPIKRIVLTPLTEPSDCHSTIFPESARSLSSGVSSVYSLSPSDSADSFYCSNSTATHGHATATASASDAETICFTNSASLRPADPQDYSPHTPPLSGRNRLVLDGTQDPSESPFDGEIGRKLCRDYVRIEKIGQGDFGTVWKAYHLLERRYYAVKQFTKKFRGETDRQRRLQEVYALSACAGMCRYIVKYYDSWTEGNTLFVKMEYCDGGSVRRALPVGSHVWSDAELWELIFQIGIALCSLHLRDIVHLDVKMDNVYIKHDGERRVYKLGDFGLVRFDLDEGAAWSPSGEYGLSENAMRGLNDDEGDKRYLCPTYLSTNRFWKEADVYAFGLNLYELASGRAISGVPEEAHSAGLAGMDHLAPALRDLIAAMCHRDPRQRPTAFQAVTLAEPHVVQQ